MAQKCKAKIFISVQKYNFYHKNIIPSTKNIYPSITVLCLSQYEDVISNNYLLNAKWILFNNPIDNNLI